jgi:YggT family protein
MTADTLISLVRFVAGALNILILARIVVSWLSVNPWNPIVRWLRRIVDPILRPFRRILPTFGGIDFSPLLAILVIYFVERLIESIIVALTAGGSVSVAANVLLLLRDLVTNILIVLAVLVLIRLLLSLFNADPWHPLVQGIRGMTNPLVAPFSALRRRSLRSGVDFPAIAALATYVVLYFVAQLLFTQLLLHTA